MIETILEVHGMACGMCESHINSEIRKRYPVSSVRADRKKKQVVILSENPIEEEGLRNLITDLGYDAGLFRTEKQERRKNWTGWLKRK